MSDFKIGKLLPKGACHIDANVSYHTTLGWKMVQWVPIALAKNRQQAENALLCMNEFYKDGFQNPGQDGLLKIMTDRILESAESFYNDEFWKDPRNRSLVMQITSRIESMNACTSQISFDDVSDSVKRMRFKDSSNSVEDEEMIEAAQVYVDKAFKAICHFESMMSAAVEMAEVLRGVAREYIEGAQVITEYQSDISKGLKECLEAVESFGIDPEYVSKFSRSIKPIESDAGYRA